MHLLTIELADRSWPSAEVSRGEYRGTGMRPEAAGRLFRVIISAADPLQPFVTEVL